jgi:HK97 family phage portal protein
MEILKPFLNLTRRSSPSGWRVTPENDQLLGRLFSAPMSKTGLRIDATTAQRATTVYACTRVLSEDVAAMPAVLYQSTGDGFREKATGEALWEILHDLPNKETTAIEFWQMVMWSALLRGVSFSEKIYDGAGRLRSLKFLHPDQMRPLSRKSSRELPAWEHTDEFGEKKRLTSEDLFIVRGPFGRSVIENCKEAIALQIAQEDYAAAFFGNFGSPRGVIEFTNNLGEDEEQVKRWKKNFIDAYAGPGNNWGVAILENGAKFNPISVTHQDAEFLESRKFQRTEVCGIFRVPPHMIGELSRSTYSNIEQQSLDYINQSLVSWLVRIQQAAYRDLLNASQRKRLNFEFLTAGLMRGDLLSRYTAYKMGREGGWLSPNMIGRSENLPKISAEEGGDTFIMPANMIPASQAGKSLQQKPEQKESVILNVRNDIRRESIQKTVRMERDPAGNLQAQITETVQEEKENGDI